MWRRSWQTNAVNPCRPSAPAINGASRPVGASTRTNSSRGSAPGMVITPTVARLLPLPDEPGRSGQYPLELVEDIPYLDSPRPQVQLPDGILMRARALLDRGNGAAQLAGCLEIAQHQDRVGEETDVCCRFQ